MKAEKQFDSIVRLSEIENRLAWAPVEFARALGLSLPFIRLEIARGKLKTVKRGRRRLIPAHIARQYAGMDLR